jgi:hypothetical protein
MVLLALPPADHLLIERDRGQLWVPRSFLSGDQVEGGLSPVFS